MSALKRLRQEECKFKALGLQSENLSLKNIFLKEMLNKNTSGGVTRQDRSGLHRL